VSNSTEDLNKPQSFPGGESEPAYGYALKLWLFLFLGVLCLGMLNFLGIYLKRL